MNIIADLAALRDHMGPVGSLAERKVLPRLDTHCCHFIELATADAQSGADS